MSEPLTNPLLQQVQEALEKNMQPQLRTAYEKAVADGREAGLRDGLNSIVAGLAKSKDPISDAVKGAIGVTLILRNHSKGGLPMQAAVPAATDLMLRALDFLGQAKIMKIGVPELERAAHIFGDDFLRRMGITREQMIYAMHQSHAMLQDPQARQKMQAYADGAPAVQKAPAAGPAANANQPPAPAPAGGGLINGPPAGTA
jgi:hypothetical protein